MLRSPSPVRVLLLALAASAALASPALAGGPRPETLPLPNGFQPEGIATYDRDEVLVGSIPTGALYRLNVTTGQGALLAPAVVGRSAVGIKVAFGKVFVSGGATGKVRVHDARTGAVLREEQAGTAGSTFVNDVTVTRRAAYFTDSRAAQIYELPHGGGPLRRIVLTGDFRLVPDVNNLNGIAAARNGWLLSVQSSTGKLFRIDPRSGETKAVDLGGYVLADGDGLLLEHKLLSVVQNRLNKVAQLKLSGDLLRGRLVRTLTDPGFDVPTTIARVKRSLYAVNARFGTTPTLATPYTVVRVDGSERRHHHGDDRRHGGRDDHGDDPRDDRHGDHGDDRHRDHGQAPVTAPAPAPVHAPAPAHRDDRRDDDRHEDRDGHDDKDDDRHDDDNSGPGNGDDRDDQDSSGPGS
jgi:hypothetical protein